MTLDRIMQDCVIDGKHWIWKGASGRGTPRVWSPDLARGGKKQSMAVHRVVWQVLTGKAVPEGHRAYRTCSVPMCVSPECVACGPPKEWGALMSASGRNKSTATSIARLALARRKRLLSDAQILHVQLSEERGDVLAAQLGVSPTLISKARRGHYQTTNPYAALMRP